MSYKIITRGNQDLSADFFNNGAYGDLFIIAGSEKVLKVFRRRENEYENFIASNTCRSEILAYEILRREPKLSLMAPNFYGRLELQQILEDEEDVSNRYLLHSAYIMGFIDGKFRKVSQDAAAQAEIERFHTVGVRYTVDAEVCRRQEGLKFIDFGVVGVREEIEDLRYYYLPYEEKFKLFYERVPELREDWRRGVSSLN